MESPIKYQFRTARSHTYLVSQPTTHNRCSVLIHPEQQPTVQNPIWLLLLLVLFHYAKLTIPRSDTQATQWNTTNELCSDRNWLRQIGSAARTDWEWSGTKRRKAALGVGAAAAAAALCENLGFSQLSSFGDKLCAERECEAKSLCSIFSVYRTVHFQPLLRILFLSLFSHYFFCFDFIRPLNIPFQSIRLSVHLVG